MTLPFLSLAYALAEFIPVIGQWIGGENGEEAAHNIVDIAKKITGEHEPLKILQSLKASPQLIADFQKKFFEMEHLFNIEEFKDRQSARARDIAFAQVGRSNLRADIMVLSAAFGLIACLLTITCFRTSLPGEAVGIISTIAGIFGSCLKDAYTFEFGSSRGSKLKDRKLATFMNNEYRR